MAWHGDRWRNHRTLVAVPLQHERGRKHRTIVAVPLQQPWAVHGLRPCGRHNNQGDLAYWETLALNGPMTFNGWANG
jgi:hypothetical protein